MSQAKITTDCEILVVEDSLTQALKLQHILTSTGYRVSLARDGREAIAALEKRVPALVISDIVMPNMDGYATCRAIKNNPKWELVPVVLLTNLTDPKDIIQGLKAQADCYLTKPYKTEYLLQSIADLMANPRDSLDEGSSELEIMLAGTSYAVKADRRQMLNLLLSIYGSAVQRNCELEETQAQLQNLNEQLEVQRQALQEANARLQTLASDDDLTSLKNRRTFNERFETELTRTARSGQILSLLMIDVDHFKKLNDGFGHVAGDKVLSQLGFLLREASRGTDFVARFGGEEFAVLLTDTDAHGARIWAERIRNRIEQYPWTPRAVTVSVGITTCSLQRAKTLSASQLINEADQALYRSKHDGRNRITSFEELV
ncbi:diguanylate cyclase (GGDEF) domain-containing protein [Abditibacterium utsteinense]|uniref:diguanylate cyclase n=1 Tax=Abditibacterium utsteinense TaxID=1960156 RepID=A0A2S8STY7_9BACT|nr:diguanylate cyclase [Abditibacterium utsteinense]PQV64209.1 diguanylate cyclase (GGDEF) domain-containing protein [Abditibacterium utsteinense]